MFGKMLEFARRQTLGLLALVVAIGGTAFAASNQRRAPDPRLHACVKRAGGDMRLVSPRARCARGERRVTWNRQGVRGLTGAPGQPGAQGERGLDGQQGPQGAQGPPGPTASAGSQNNLGVTLSNTFREVLTTDINLGFAGRVLATANLEINFISENTRQEVTCKMLGPLDRPMSTDMKHGFLDDAISFGLTGNLQLPAGTHTIRVLCMLQAGEGTAAAFFQGGDIVAWAAPS